MACVGRFSRSDSPCRPSFSCLTKFTTRFSFLTIPPLLFSAGSWEKYPCTMARRSPPHFFRRATIEKERMFEGVKVSREIHPKFSLCFDDSLSTCIIVVGNFFCFVYDSSLRFFSFSFFGLIFLSGTREGKIVRKVTNEISYLLEMKRI